MIHPPKKDESQIALQGNPDDSGFRRDALGILVSEWNVGEDEPTNSPISGMERNAGLMRVLYEMIENGVDYATFWTAETGGYAGLSWDDVGAPLLSPTGQLFRMMSENLPGLQLLDGELMIRDENENLVGYSLTFEDAGRTVVYFVSGSSTAFDIDADFAELVDGSTHVQATLLGTQPGYASDDYNALGQLTLPTGTALGADGAGGFDFTLNPYEVIQFVFADTSGGAGVTVHGDDQNALPDVISGSSNNDSLWGEGGNDSLSALAGNDALDGGDGKDELWAGGGNDTLIGGTGNDTMGGGGGNDTASGGDGSDLVAGGTGSDVLWGGTGNDVLQGGTGNDTLGGGNGNDTLTGGSGTDSMGGGNGADLLSGGAASDTLQGGAGNDTLNGGSGSDRMTGGSGGDSFVFEGNFGEDVITDFDVAVANERIDLSGVSEITSFADLVDNHLSMVGGDAVISALNGNSITLVGIDASTLSAGDFLF